jgi:hypothetical protein
MKSLTITDWHFLFKVLLILIFWLTARYFYKHSFWMQSNKLITIYGFPRPISFIEKLINKYEIFQLIFGLLVISTFLGGVFFVYILGKGAIKEFEHFLNLQAWWGQIFILGCIILCYFGINIWWDSNKKKSFLSSKKEPISKYSSYAPYENSEISIPQKISEIDPLRIPTYPRFTVYDFSVDKEQLIFDSSDFSIIIKAFGLVDKFNNTLPYPDNLYSILTGRYLNLKGKKYWITDVEIDFLDIFDDYSINPFGRHTKVYEGRDVPYNIQIIIKTNRKQNLTS